jgi:hypothetical protein
MATVLESLKSLSSYPVPSATLTRVAGRRGLTLSAEATAGVLRSQSYRLAEADLMKWLSKAPSVSESGVSFSFSQSERDSLIREANEVYLEYGEITQETEFGYIGDSI